MTIIQDEHDGDSVPLADGDESAGPREAGRPTGSEASGEDLWAELEQAQSPPARRRNARERHRRFRSLIKNCPVVGFTGANGAGKTLVAVSEAIQDLRVGRRVVSTVPINYRGLRSEPLLSYRQLLDLENCTLLVDEVSVVFSSRATGEMPQDVVTFLQTMRHQDVTLRWTAPSWKRADLLVREVTQAVVGVHGLARYTVKGEFWPKPRLVLCGMLETVSIATDDDPEKIIGRRIWAPKRLPGWGAYDSMADVERLGGHAQDRRCLDCGGTKRPEPCSPERHQKLGIIS